MKIKKLLLIFLSLVFAFGVTSLYACGETCKHVYDYTCNASSHWQECFCGAVKEGSEKPHNFVGGVCEECTQAQFAEGLDFTKIVKGEEITYHVKRYSGNATSVEIPSAICGKAVTGVAYRAFEGCSELVEISIPDTVVFFGDYAFEGCTSLNYKEEEGFKYLGNPFNPYLYLASSTDNTRTKIAIKDSVQFVGTNAFYYHKSLKEVVIPTSVKGFAKGAFEGCKEDTLKEVNYLGTANEWAQIYFSEPSANAIYYAKSLYLKGTKLKDLVLSVPEISGYSFFDCNFETLTLQEGVVSVGQSAFQACNYRKSSTEEDFFKSLRLPSTLTTIGHSAFRNCSNLRTVTVTTSLKEIGTHAFANCHDLASISYPGTKEEWNAIKFGYDWTYEATKLSQIRCSNGSIYLSEAE